MVITVFGLGFVGLTTALGMANAGNKVYGIDVDRKRFDTINRGIVPFHEPQLGDVLKKNINHSFFLTQDVEKAISESKVVFYCVGTPYSSDKSADLSYLISAVDSTLMSIKDNKFRVLVIKSTVPPSTTSERILPYIESRYSNLIPQTGLANNPEFLREGHCFDDFVNADRIVLGCEDEISAGILRELYKPFNIPIHVVTHNTGEFIKYLSNTLLATMISFSNEMSLVAMQIGNIEIGKAFHILHDDKRFGGCDMTSYVYPGCGYGGYCLPKDTNALYEQSRQKGFEPKILKNVIDLNDNMAHYISENIVKNLNKDAKIGILGLSFKPGSDDVRETPAVKIINELSEMGYKSIYAYDPIAIDEFKRHYKMDIHYENNMHDLYFEADVIVIVTAWQEFLEIKKLGDKPVFDLRYMLQE